MGLDGKHPVLLLNADYQPLSYFPLSVLPWQRAVKGIVEGTLQTVSEYEVTIRSPSVEMKIPSVVALRQYQRTARRVAFTRFNVFLRDHFRCQYCGGKFQSHELTFDHVIPRALGGQTTWENIVSACEPCNSQKDHGTTMKPLRWPKQPTVGELLKARRAFPPNYLHETWIDHLYWSTELDEDTGPA